MATIESNPIEARIGVGQVGVAGQGPHMIIVIKADRDRIVQARFMTYGCPAANACGQCVCEEVEDRSVDQAEQIDEKLWEFDEDAFIPHQIAGDDDDAITPVLIASPDAQPADRPLVINLRDDCAPGLFERVLEVVPADEDQRAGSRQRWKTYQHAGFEVKKFDM